MLKPEGQQESLLSRVRDVATHPVTLSAAALMTILGVSREVAADMVACGIRSPGKVPALVVDDIEPTGGTNRDKVYQPGPGFNIRLTGDKPLHDKGSIYGVANYPNDGGLYYAAFNFSLEKTGEVAYPELYPISQILGDHDIAVSYGSDSTMYHLTATEFEQMGKTSISGRFTSYGGYNFYTNFQETGGSTNKNNLNVVSDDDVLANQNPDGKIAETTLTVDYVPTSSTTQNDPEIDSSVSPAVVLVPTQQASTGEFGVMEVPLGVLVNGHLPPPSTWGTTYNFVPTGYSIDRIYVDNTKGNAAGTRYFLSAGNIHIQPFDGGDYEIPADMFPNGISQILVIDGGLMVIENDSTKPTFIRRTSNPAFETIPGKPFVIYESEEFPGGGALGKIQGCANVDTPVDPCATVNPDDGDACTEDKCDPITGAVTNVAGVIPDDGDACTVDGCNPFTGEFTYTQIETSDGDACTLDSCDKATGVVTHVTNIPDDGDSCTTNTCDTATGEITYVPMDVDDGDNCTVDICVDGTATYTPKCDEGTTCDSATGDCNPDVVDPGTVEAGDPDVVEPGDPDAVEGVDVNADPNGEPTDPDVNADPNGEPATPDEASGDSIPTEVGPDVIPDEFADLTPDELQEAFDNLQADDGTNPPDANKPDAANPDATPEGTDVAGSDKGPNDPNDPDVTEGETTGTPDNSAEVKGEGSGGSCTVGGIGTNSRILTLLTLAGLALARRRKKGLQQ